jgi:hypothetical protein
MNSIKEDFATVAAIVRESLPLKVTLVILSVAIVFLFFVAIA